MAANDQSVVDSSPPRHQAEELLKGKVMGGTAYWAGQLAGASPGLLPISTRDPGLRGLYTHVSLPPGFTKEGHQHEIPGTEVSVPVPASSLLDHIRPTVSLNHRPQLQSSKAPNMACLRSPACSPNGQTHKF